MRTLPTLKKAFLDARRAGRSIYTIHGAIIFSFMAGDDMKALAERFNLSQVEVEEIIRAYTKR